VVDDQDCYDGEGVGCLDGYIAMSVSKRLRMEQNRWEKAGDN